MSQTLLEKKFAKIDLVSIEKVVNAILGKQGKILDSFTRDDLIQDATLFVLQTANPAEDKLKLFLKNRLKELSGNYRNRSFSTLASYFEDEINVDEYVSAKKTADTPWDSDKKTRKVSKRAIKLTEARVREMFKLRSLGWTLNELAVHFSVSKTVISETLNRHHWKSVKLKKELFYTKPGWVRPWRPRLPEHLYEKIVTLRRDGKTHKEIGLLVGYNHTSIRRVLKKVAPLLENKIVAENNKSKCLIKATKMGYKIYDHDIAKKIVTLYDEQSLKSFRKISKLLGISNDSAWNWYHRYKGTIPRKYQSHKKSSLSEH